MCQSRCRMFCNFQSIGSASREHSSVYVEYPKQQFVDHIKSVCVRESNLLHTLYGNQLPSYRTNYAVKIGNLRGHL
uniref:SFRICE_006186 n=1 Tax=Spodoptera frugiperda TaxID=7108 RepID=A0A2H1VVN4_SPOFR